jgi:hypothetical protein
MAEFKGSNTTKSGAQLMYDRALYNKQAFPENGGLGPTQVLNFNFAERTFYGRVNRQHDPVIPKNEFLSSLGNEETSTTLMAMNFVADQFNGFQAHFYRATRMALIPQGDSVLSQIQATKAYTDPVSMYQDYADRLITEYYRNYLETRKDKVLNFNDFLDNLILFLDEKTSIDPLTLSGFQRSNHSSVYTSGLTIDIAGISFGEDGTKQSIMLENKAFQFYLNLANQYGFSVNKNNPSVLICNLENPATITHRSKYNLPNLSTIFNNQYDRTIFYDLQELKKIIKTGYNNFVSKNRVHKTVYLCDKLTKIRTTTRQYINEINDNDIILLYIKVRNIEERKPYNESQLESFYEIALRVQKKSNLTMMDYIDKQFKSKYNFKKGSLTYHLKRMKKKLDN